MLRKATKEAVMAALEALATYDGSEEQVFVRALREVPRERAIRALEILSQDSSLSEELRPFFELAFEYGFAIGSKEGFEGGRAYETSPKSEKEEIDSEILALRASVERLASGMAGISQNANRIEAKEENLEDAYADQMKSLEGAMLLKGKEIEAIKEGLTKVANWQDELRKEQERLVKRPEYIEGADKIQSRIEKLELRTADHCEYLEQRKEVHEGLGKSLAEVKARTEELDRRLLSVEMRVDNLWGPRIPEQFTGTMMPPEETQPSNTIPEPLSSEGEG